MIDRWLFPNTVLFGWGAVKQLPQELESRGARRPLVVTDPGLLATALPDRIRHLLDGAGLSASIFSDVHANPTEANVEAGVASYHAGGCDSVVGLGGGSAIDAAKAIRLRATHDPPLRQYAFAAGGAQRIVHEMPVMAAVATTAGTGSDVARGSVIRMEPDGAKLPIVGESIYPSISCCDPELTLELPPKLTAGTGLDALTHCIEEYLSPRFNPLIDGMALEGIRLITRSLTRTCEDGTWQEGRTHLMVGAMIGGIGFIKGLGVVHSLTHAVGGVVGGHHGTLNAVLLPGCLEFNFEAVKPRFRRLAEAAGLDVRTHDDPSCGQALIEFLRRLNTALEVPQDLSSFGVRKEHISQLVPLCVQDHCHKTNPRPVASEDFRALLEQHIP